MRKEVKTASFLIVVLVMVVVSPALAFTANDNSCIPGDSAIVLVGIQQADGSINIVYLNPDNTKSHSAGVWGEAVSMLPDAMTIAMLGLAGLLYRRRPAFARLR